MDERLQREMEHVQAPRHAREHAEPWRPPAVDAVGAVGAVGAAHAVPEPADRVWFADTAVEPHTRQRAP